MAIILFYLFTYYTPPPPFKNFVSALAMSEVYRRDSHENIFNFFQTHDFRIATNEVCFLFPRRMYQ